MAAYDLLISGGTVIDGLRTPAQAAGICDRGFLREGAPADLLVYDLEQLRVLPAERLHDFPAGDWRLACKAVGYRCVVVNGELTFEDGHCSGATPGRLLRSGRVDHLDS